MVRLAAACSLSIWFLASTAMAGQTSASFAVGIVIGGPQTKSAAAAAAPAPSQAKRYTWGAATISLKSAGFADMRRISRSGRLYWFAAVRDGRAYRVAVSIATGAVVKVIPA